MSEDVISTLIEVKLSEPDKFSIVRETLTRIGISSRKTKTLYQSCHILHKRGKYYIVHFKELFKLDGKPTNFSDEDRARRNRIAQLLHDWGLVELVTPFDTREPMAAMNQLKILSHGDKDGWTLESKYEIGVRS